MCLRMQKLELAVAEIQKTVSSEPHPLLVKDSQIDIVGRLPSRQPESDARTHARHHRPPDVEADLVKAFGVLSIINDGTQFHGETASSEVCNRALSHGPFATSLFIF